MIVAGLLGTSRLTSQREAWKSSMKICACSSEVGIHWPFAGVFALEQRGQNAQRAEQAGASRRSGCRRAPGLGPAGR